jgi:hypothetical protein
LLSNRFAIWNEINLSDFGLREYLRNEFSDLILNPYFEEWIDAVTGYASPVALYQIIPKMRELVYYYGE